MALKDKTAGIAGGSKAGGSKAEEVVKVGGGGSAGFEISLLRAYAALCGRVGDLSSFSDALSTGDELGEGMGRVSDSVVGDVKAIATLLDLPLQSLQDLVTSNVESIFDQSTGDTSADLFVSVESSKHASLCLGELVLKACDKLGLLDEAWRFAILSYLAEVGSSAQHISNTLSGGRIKPIKAPRGDLS
jgi:hypothetical protein